MERYGDVYNESTDKSRRGPFTIGGLSEEEAGVAYAALAAYASKGRCPKDRARSLRAEALGFAAQAVLPTVRALARSRFGALGCGEDAEHSALAEVMGAFDRYDGRASVATFARPYALAGLRQWAAFAAAPESPCDPADLAGAPAPQEAPLDPDLGAALDALSGFEEAVLLICSGAAPGLGGRREPRSTACADPAVVAAALGDPYASKRVSFGPFPQRAFEERSMAYTAVESGPVAHVDRGCLDAALRRAKRRARAALSGGTGKDAKRGRAP